MHGSKIKLMLIDIEPKPPQIWNGNESNEFLKMGQIKRNTSHSDFSTCIAAHPKLSLYVTGHNKGKLWVWPFNNLTDTTVGNEYYTYHQRAIHQVGSSPLKNECLVTMEINLQHLIVMELYLFSILTWILLIFIRSSNKSQRKKWR